MKKLSLAIAALAVAALPALANAQTTATATVNASATVVADLTATTTHQLKFGNLALGASSTLAASGASQAALSGLTTAGLGQVQVNHNSNVGVAATVPAALTNTATGQTLGFSATCATSSSSGGAGAAVANCASFAFNAAAPGTLQSTYVLVGGTVTGSAAAGIGTFAGDVVFTFTATN